MSIAEAARDAGIARANSGVDPEWKLAARRALWHLIQGGQEFTADDVWELIPPGLVTPEPRAMGAVITAAKRAGFVRHVRYGRSRTTSGHMHPISVWVGCGSE